MIVAATFLLALVHAWRAQGGRVTCTSKLEQHSSSPESYVQIELQRQDPVEPTFYGQLWSLLYEDPKTTSVEIWTTAAQGYHNTRFKRQVIATEPQFLEVQERLFTVGPIENYVLNPISGSHPFFPFDSASFDFVVKMQPHIDFSRVDVINRVDGFVFNCSTMSSSRLADDRTRISFTLHRNPFVQLCALVIAGASIAFAILILRSKSIEALSGAAASLFFSTWSVRSVLSSQIHVFPTLFDLIILTANMAILVLVFLRVVLGTKNTSRNDVPI